MRIINSEAIEGPCQRIFAAEILRLAKNFDVEYMRPDDPARHCRVFTVVEAQADLLLRFQRDRHGNESILIVGVEWSHDEPTAPPW